MKNTDIERIIKQGSTKQKIKLYFTDLAYFNTKGMYTCKIKDSGGTLTLDRPDKILTDKERDIIYNSIKEPKDIKYYAELRNANISFLLFKPIVTIYVKNFNGLAADISKFTLVRLLHKKYENAINDILEVVEDKKLREKLVKTALESLKQFHANKYQEKGFLPFIEIPEDDINGTVWLLIEKLNNEIKEAKEYIKGLETFLNKSLPLKPYKQFLKNGEEQIKAYIQECIKFIESFTSGKTEDEILQDENRFKILNWDEVEVEVADEDIEDIKNAGR